jgi:hypothetical protein
MVIRRCETCSLRLSDTLSSRRFFAIEGGGRVAWVYEGRLYDSRSVASYVAMCVRDDHVLRGERQPVVQIYRTRRGNYGVRYQPPVCM